MNNRVKAAWAKWREVAESCAIRRCLSRSNIKSKKPIIKPAMTYGCECWAVKKKDTQTLPTTEMRMLRWVRDKTKKDNIKNEDI